MLVQSVCVETKAVPMVVEACQTAICAFYQVFFSQNGNPIHKMRLQNMSQISSSVGFSIRRRKNPNICSRGGDKGGERNEVFYLVRVRFLKRTFLFMNEKGI